jgi:hypothetical protein
MSDHKQFETLCALAVVGQASDPDLRQLKSHLETCVDCRTRIADFAQISAQALPLSGKRYGNVRSPKAMTARFVERARVEGIPVQASGQTMSGGLSFGFGWKGCLAGALLLAAMIVGGISKSGHSRAHSAETAATVKLELPNQRLIHAITQKHSSTQRTRILSVRRQTSVPNARFVETGSLRPELNRNHGFLGPELGSGDIQLTAKLSGQTISNDPRMHDSNSGKTWLLSPWLAPNAEHDPKKGADYGGTDPKGCAMFATVSLNSPFHVFPYLSDQFLSGGLAITSSKWHPKIDWGEMRSHALVPNLNDLPEYRPDVLTPEWPFSKASKADQQ